MRKGSKKQDDTLCWDCKRACGGWKARETTVRMQSTINGVPDNTRSVVSSIVEACPLYVPDRRTANG